MHVALSADLAASFEQHKEFKDFSRDTFERCSEHAVACVQGLAEAKTAVVGARGQAMKSLLEAKEASDPVAWRNFTSQMQTLKLQRSRVER